MLLSKTEKMKITKQSVDLVDHMGSDLNVVNAARVSFAKESEWEQTDAYDGQFYLNEKDQKLIAYLAKHRHWTPFAHCFVSFRIKAPIFVARQLAKHQVGLAWNEVSRRYVDDEPEFYFPEEWRGKPVNAKQGSSDIVLTQMTLRDQVTGEPWYTEIDNVVFLQTEQTLHAYKALIRNGVAPEQARMVLPQNTMTEWIWSGSLAAFARVCSLRLDSHAQAETREIAQKINDLIPNGFTHSWKALLE